MLLVFLGNAAQYKLVLFGVAFPISAGRQLETNFQTRFGTSYTAEVEFRRMNDSHREGCLLGGDLLGKPCDNIPKQLEVEWVVSSEGREIAKGVSRADDGVSGWGERLSRKLVTFSASSFTSYQLNVKNFQASEELSAQAPILRVVVAPRALEAMYFTNFFLGLFFLVSASVGAFNLLNYYLALRNLKKRRASATQLE